jgi:hypothetical protein
MPRGDPEATEVGLGFTTVSCLMLSRPFRCRAGLPYKLVLAHRSELQGQLLTAYSLQAHATNEPSIVMMKILSETRRRRPADHALQEFETNHIECACGRCDCSFPTGTALCCCTDL